MFQSRERDSISWKDNTITLFMFANESFSPANGILLVERQGKKQF